MSAEVRAFIAITPEMQFWQRILRPLLRPPPGLTGALARALRFAMVTPTAHLAWLSAPFQLYLYAVFHQTRVARIGHRIGFPITIAALCAALAPMQLGAPATLTEALRTPSLAMFGTILLAAYHVYLAITFRSLVFGAVIVSLGLLLHVAGVGWAWSLETLGPEGGASWTPLAVALAASALVACSHAGEPALPPRVTGTDRWIRTRAFVDFSQPLRALACNLSRTLAALTLGVLDELWGAPRLYALVVLRDLGRLGLDGATQAQIDTWTAEAIESGNPALDFIGVGGGAPLPSAP